MDEQDVTGTETEVASEQEAAAAAAAEEATAKEASEKHEKEGEPETATEGDEAVKAEEAKRKEQNRLAAEKRIAAKKAREFEIENARLKGRLEALEESRGREKESTATSAGDDLKVQFERETPKPKEGDFETHADFVEALTDWKTDQKDWIKSQRAQVETQATERKSAQQEIFGKVQSVDREGLSKYDDFDIVTAAENLELTDMQKAYLLNSEPGTAADLEYYLGSNPAENERISRLSPFLQNKELLRLEDKIASGAVQLKKTSKAPPPPSTVDGKNSAPNKNLLAENVSTEDRIKMIRENRMARARG